MNDKKNLSYIIKKESSFTPDLYELVKEIKERITKLLGVPV